MISSFGYSLKQGFKNIGRNMLFSLASIATIAACIFLFCLGSQGTRQFLYFRKLSDLYCNKKQQVDQEKN